MTRIYLSLIAVCLMTMVQAQNMVNAALLYQAPKDDWNDLNGPEPLQIEVVLKNIGCKDHNKGSIETEPKGGIPPYQWKWSTGATIPQISDLEAGTYHLTLTDITGTEIVETFHIVEVPPITIDFLLSPDDLDHKFVEAKVNGGEGPYRYIWNTGLDEPTIRAKENTTYAVRVFDEKGCQGTRLIDIGTIGSEFVEKSYNSVIKIMPNPSDGLINIEYPDHFQHTSNVEVFNNFGQFIRRYPKVTAHTKNIEIDLTGLEGGVYFVRIEWAGQSILKKVILL